MKYLCVVLAAIALAICAASAPAQSSYRFVDLADTFNGRDSAALGINDSGMVVGVYWPHRRARGFTLDLKTMEVKPVRKLRAASESVPIVINGSGQMAGVSYSQLGLPYATKWNEGTPRLLPTSSMFSNAYGISDSGTVVGVGNGQACYWDQSGIHYLPIKRGYRFATAFWVNQQGTACGAMGNLRVMQPCIWKNMRHKTLLGTLGGPVGEAWAVNDYNTVVGWSTDANYMTRAFVWDEMSGMRPLGMISPAGSFEFNYALGINNNGVVVGVAITENEIKSFFWTEAAGMIALDAPIDAWLVVANAINNRGEIVGYYVDSLFYTHACMWEPD